MKDYTKAKIYKIINFTDKQIYVESTVQSLVYTYDGSWD